MAIAGGNIFDPRSLSPALWLSDTGSDPAVWEDLSGNGRHATQATAANRPAIVENVQNGRQVRRFDIINDFYTTGLSTINGNRYTIFAVANQRETSTFSNGGRGSHVIGAGRGGNDTGLIRLGTETYSGVQTVFGGVSGSNFKNGSSQNITFNGFPTGWNILSVVTGAANISSPEASIMLISTLRDSFSTPAWFSGCDIAEILVLPYVATTEQRKAVENYLAKKWGIGFNPLSLSPALWLSDTGSNPAQWDDISGNNRHATQATVASQPAIIQNGLGGRQVRRFDGVDDQLSGDRLLSSSNFSAFVVLKAIPQNAKGILTQRSTVTINVGRTEILSCSDTGSLNSPRVFFNNGTSYNLTGSSIMLDNTPKIVHVKSTATGTTSVGINGGIEEILLTGQTWTPENVNYTLGNAPLATDRFFNGDIAEILVFPSTLSDSDRREVERYLAQKWNIIT